VRAEIDERSRRSMERRLRYSGIKGFKPMADFDWNWPAKIERDVIERALTLDFLSESRNLVLVGRNGLGKTMIAQNICHAAVLAGSPVFFRSARRCSKICIARRRKGGAASCAAMPTSDFLTTRPPTYSMKSSIAGTNASR
jgi:DNA replication protein DnaC